MTDLPTVLVVEDDDATRTRLCNTIDDHPGLHFLDGAASYAEGLQRLTDSPPSVLLTDLGLPDGSGLDLIRAVMERGFETESMVITVFGDEHHVLAAIEAGATGYLLKDNDAKAVAEGILQLLDGGSPISPGIARHVLRKLSCTAGDQSRKSSSGLLTARERDVLGMLAKGLLYAEVAEVLGISSGTVCTHIKHIYRKLAVHSRGEAVFEALQLGLLDFVDQ